MDIKSVLSKGTGDIRELRNAVCMLDRFCNTIKNEVQFYTYRGGEFSRKKARIVLLVNNVNRTED